jgi:Protein of unknown function (DUF3667)
LAKHANLPVNCGNCGAALAGPYCAQCGQHAHESVRSISALVHDAWHLATHVDGRFWKSIYFLFLRPGNLTKEYFEDHRARYIPPVRLYLVISVLFFAFVASTPHPSGHHPPPAVAAAPNAGSAEPAKAAPAASAAKSFSPGEDKLVDDDDEKDDKPDATDAGINDFVQGFSDCKDMHYPWVWLAHRMHEVCERYDNNIAQPVEQNLYHNLPRMMIVFAPLVAVAMLLIYWFPRRYYVEHVVFFLHNHAAIFLIWIFVVLLRFIGKQAHWNWLGTWAFVLGMLYMLWYVYKSMRVFYSQGRFLTFSKMMFMYVVYFSVLSVTALATFLISVLTA